MEELFWDTGVGVRGLKRMRSPPAPNSLLGKWEQSRHLTASLQDGPWLGHSRSHQHLVGPCNLRPHHSDRSSSFFLSVPLTWFFVTGLFNLSKTYFQIKQFLLYLDKYLLLFLWSLVFGRLLYSPRGEHLQFGLEEDFCHSWSPFNHNKTCWSGVEHVC